MKHFLLLMLVFLALPVSAIEVYDFETPEQEALYQELAKDLRCLVCQNQNLADSEAGLAKDLKNQVAEFVMAGKDAETIKKYMIDRYGDFVTYNPPMNASTAFLWFAPLVVFLIGAVVLYINIRNKPHD